MCLTCADCIIDAITDTNACRSFTSEEKTTAQVKAEIDRFLREKSSIESSFPAGVVVGPFHVVVEGLRIQLARKCRELATALLEFMVKKLREESAEICEQFMEISRKLFEKPNSIEVCTHTLGYLYVNAHVKLLIHSCTCTHKYPHARHEAIVLYMPLNWSIHCICTIRLTD